ncbi:MAG: NUDIX hydrolase [Bacteroidota bacterium]
MKYCSKCGSNDIKHEIPQDDHRLRNVCSNCNSVFYENPRIVVGTIPVFNNKILLAKRGIEPQIGKWNLPAGFLEVNESIEHGARRETIEETGAEISELILHTMFQANSNHLYIFYLAKLESDKNNTTVESTEIEFFDLDNIPWNDLAFTSNNFALKSYIDAESSSQNIYFASE